MKMLSGWLSRTSKIQPGMHIQADKFQVVVFPINENAALFEAAISLSVGFHDQYDKDGKDTHCQVQGQLKS